jgi:TRAP-type mannitol/chloroaromatic compound transport system permease large subunit
MNVLTLFLTALFGFILLTVPIAFALFLTALVLALAMGAWSPALVIQNIFRGIDSFPLMAIPFFLLAGEIMNTGGISERIILVAKAMCGHVRGGLGYVTVVASMLISGWLPPPPPTGPSSPPPFPWSSSESLPTFRLFGCLSAGSSRA